ncbi:MAG: transcription termination/antitermination protein NusA [Desulfobacterales bacterium]|nr:transcription termination/antitermination protein NusA [Desulfobacterales bacterium]
MLITDIKRVIEQVSRDKGIESMVLVSAIEEAIKSAAKKKLGSRIEIEVKYNEDTGEIEVFQFREVVEEITDPDTQITIKQGKKLDPECEAGDSLGIKTDMSSLGRIAAQSAKQVIIQKMKDAERDAVYSGFIGRKGEIINGIVQRIDRGNIIVNLGHTEGILAEREQVSGEIYRRGDRVRAYIMDVRHDTRGPQVVLSRTHPNFLINLFKTEVPEISEGIVNITGAAREPGSRAKFAVVSNDSDIDPVGACVGMKGSRVQNVVQELKGEKIDIIPWHVDPAKFVCNALAPAEISRVIIDEENRSMEVIVPDEFLSIAIGKGGQNVRLASKLTKWRLDVKSETRYSKTMQDGYNSLMALPDIGISMADALYEKGFFSAEELSRANAEDVIQAIDITEQEAVGLLENAKNYVINLDTDAETSDNIPDEENDSYDVSGDNNNEILYSDGSPDDPDVRKPSEKTTAGDDDYDDS